MYMYAYYLSPPLHSHHFRVERCLFCRGDLDITVKVTVRGRRKSPKVVVADNSRRRSCTQCVNKPSLIQEVGPRIKKATTTSFQRFCPEMFDCAVSPLASILFFPTTKCLLKETGRLNWNYIQYRAIQRMQCFLTFLKDIFKL